METRLEVFVNGKWERLRLRDMQQIRYNAIGNRIGKLGVTEISHSNTFTLPYIHENISVLGINVFNHRDLARSLNAKYPARYYVREKLLQKGFLVINNTQDNQIKVNFIDEGLGIIDTWGDTTFRDFLLDPPPGTPADYITAINEMKGYFLSHTEIAPQLSLVGTRGYPLSLFPNNLNAIGDKFQLDEEGLRQNDVFNPYQSRPIFNVRAFLDLITEAYGYTPIYDTSVDWENVSRSYMVASDLSKNFKQEPSTSVYGTVAGDLDSKVKSVNDGGSWTVESVCLYPLVRSTKPNLVANYVDPDPTFSTNYHTLDSIFIPDLDTSPRGAITFRVQSPNQVFAGKAWAVWSNAIPATDVIHNELTIGNAQELVPGLIEFSVDKGQVGIKPVGADELIGVIATVIETGVPADESQIGNTRVSETFLPVDAISYDEQGQFITENIDLTYAAPKKTIKSLLSSLLSKDGMLMNINNNDMTIRFFNYARYLVERRAGNYYNWSDYLLKYSPYKYNTDYGNQYAKINTIGLTDPYKSNTSTINLLNQGLDSKRKDTASNLVKDFKDVSSVSRIPNSTTPYLEYTNQGLGLIEFSRNLGPLTQTRADNTTQGQFTNLPAVANVNYLNPPLGIVEQYRLVDEAVRATPQFLLPIDVVRNIDLSIPVYIEEMGGFYIIEEIAEYVNAQTPVNVKLIKLIESSEYNNDFNKDFNT